MFTGIIVTAIWTTIQAWLLQFWMWIVGGAVAVLGLLFSPALRMWTLGAIAVAIILLAVYFYGYHANHTVDVTTHTCDEFRKYLVKGNATDKAVAIFKKHGLCV